MRYKIKIYKHGDLKTKTFFSLLPVWIGGEIRWLERVTVEYVYFKGVSGRCWWMEKRFVDKRNSCVESKIIGYIYK